VSGERTTREPAVRVLRAKGLDKGDKVMRQTVAFRAVPGAFEEARRCAAGGSGRVSGFGPLSNDLETPRTTHHTDHHGPFPIEPIYTRAPARAAFTSIENAPLWSV
jgi:hypothetical protein